MTKRLIGKLLALAVLLGILAGCLTGLLVKFDFDGRIKVPVKAKDCCKP